MARPSVVTSIGFVFCLASSSCEGDADLFTAPILRLESPDAGSPSPAALAPTPEPDTEPAGVPSAGSAQPSMPPPASAVPSSRGDAGALDPEGDAGPEPLLSTPVIAEGPVVELARLGVDGGDPRLGVCQGGVIIGVRTTANPSEEVFGQRLTFVEPICGKVLALSGTIRVTPDPEILTWATSEGFFGVPSTEVPDERLLWVPQPATVCPESTPVVVGFTGDYDPIAPDVTDTAAIRSLFIECAPLILAPDGSAVVAADTGHQLVSNADSFAAAGSATYRSACDTASVATQIKVHAGFWLDGFVLGCSRLRAE